MHASTDRTSRKAHLLRRVTLPEYDGKTDAANFFARFERACEILGGSGNEQIITIILLGKLKGVAQSWV